MVMKHLWGSWLCKPKKTDVEKREEGRGGEEREERGGEGRGERKRKETKVCHPPVEETPLLFMGNYLGLFYKTSMF